MFIIWKGVYVREETLIDIEVSDICGKKVKVIAGIEDTAVFKKILKHLK